MKGITVITAIAICTILSACSKPGGDAAATAAALRSSTSATGAASTDPVCRLYSSDDAAHYIGKPANDGDLSMGGCQWIAKDGNGNMMIQVVGARYNEIPKGSPGYRNLTDIGSDGFVATFMDGWLAGTVIDGTAIRASVSGTGVSDATAIALLKETIKRRGGAK